MALKSETAPLGALASEVSMIAIEDERIVCELLKEFVESHGMAKWLGEAHTLAEGIELYERTRPDFVLLDLHLPDGDGWMFFEGRKIRSAVIIFSGHINQAALVRLYRFPIAGFLEKGRSYMKELRAAMAKIRAGRHYYSLNIEEAIKQLQESQDSWHKILSRREVEVLPLLGSGLSNEDISRRLKIQVASARTYRQRITAKLGLRSTVELMCWAMEKGFVRIEYELFPKGRPASLGH